MKDANYQVMHTKYRVKVGPGGIHYSTGKGETKFIPRADINGIGIGYSIARKHFAVGYRIDKEFGGKLNQAPVETLPKAAALLMISYNKNEQKKHTQLQLNMGDQECMEMLKAVQSDLKDLYVGAASQALISKELKISDALVVIISIAVIALIFGLVYFFQ